MPTTSSTKKAQSASSGAESLSAFVDKVTGSNTQRISEALGEGFVRLKLGEAEKRQALQDIRCTEDAVIEMLRNARDAGANVIFLATHKTDNTRHLVMLDNGCGIPEAFHETIFEPRVTTKLDSASMDEWGIHGRGMALFSIAANADFAQVTQSEKGEGTAIEVQINIENLGEVKDQSTLPDLTKDEDNHVVLGAGPNNIYKTCASFALSEGEDSITFVGSDAEIVSSIRAFFTSRAGKSRFLTSPKDKKYGIFTGLIEAEEGEALSAAAEALGLSISQRTAHRILAKEVKPVPEILRRIKEKPKTPKKPRHNPSHSLLDFSQNKRKIRLSEEDKQELLGAFTQDLEMLQERYFLVLEREPKLTFRNGKLRVDFHLDVESDV